MLAGLAVTQTVGYGVLYYAFAVFLTPMTRDLRASSAAVTGALTVSVLVAALAAIPVGRWLDRYGGWGLMTGGSLLGGAAVFAWSQVRTIIQLYAVFVLIGVASAMVLYEAAFAVIVATTAPARRPAALLAVTIVAGFASAIFLPVAGALLQHWGWRTTVVILAVLYGGLTVPLHAIVVPRRRAPTAAAAPPPVAAARSTAVRTALRDRAFWWLVVAFMAHAGAVAIIAVHIIAYLTTRGHSAGFAATVAGLLGVLSVAGRLTMTGLARRWSTAGVTAAVFAFQATAAAALPFIAQYRIGAIACVVGFGLGFGVGTLARPALLAERYGTTGYATIAGTVTLPATMAKAIAPLAAAAAITATGGYLPVILAVVAACGVAAVTITAARKPIRPGADGKPFRPGAAGKPIRPGAAGKPIRPGAD